MKPILSKEARDIRRRTCINLTEVVPALRSLGEVVDLGGIGPPFQQLAPLEISLGGLTGNWTRASAMRMPRNTTLL